MASPRKPPREGRDSDDSFVEENEGAVFEFYGKTLNYSKTSLFLFDQGNPFRVICVRIVAHPWFDRFILLLIALNSLVLALTDWSVIDKDPTSDEVGEPIAEGSWRNTLLYESEIVFTSFFTLEFALKVVAQGFYLKPGAYLRDPWNILDFVVVVTSLMTSIPSMPKMTAIRVFRVLRPLRSVSALPGLQKLVVSMLKSVPQLVSVVIVLMFIFTVFGIFGVQIFAGKQHARCRLTPYPVTHSYETGMNYTEYRCIDESNFDVLADEPSWTQSSSLWSTSRKCWWPIDTEDERLCAYDSSAGKHKCDHDPEYQVESEFRWCGSNFDAFGNPRFEGGVIGEVEWGTEDLMKDATYINGLNWGFTTFDSIADAFLTIFQSITLTGWSDILYQVKDCSLPLLADFFFIILILWGSIFTLNLLLAVLEGHFTQGKEDEKAKKEMRRAEKRALKTEKRKRQTLLLGMESTIEERTGEEKEVVLEEEEKREEHGDEETGTGGGAEGENGEARNFPEWRLCLRRIVNHCIFQHFITGLIVLNTAALAVDHHPMDEKVSTYLEALNFAFSLCFIAEMIMKLLALGRRGYAEDKFNIFDGAIVIVGLLEMIVSPPSILGGSGDSGGGLSALRTFRVFRIFKLARKWHSMRDLLLTLHKTMVDVGNFALLLVLFMFIYALVGLQFFANRFNFDHDGEAVGIGEEGYTTALVPRSNFNNLLNAFVTIFEIMSGENWNAVMYNARRAVGWISVLYFLTLVVMGMMIVMTLFLVILLSNFSSNDEEEKDVDARDEGSSSDGEPNSAANLPLDDTIDNTHFSQPPHTSSSFPLPEQNGLPSSTFAGDDTLSIEPCSDITRDCNRRASVEDDDMETTEISENGDVGILARAKRKCKQAGAYVAEYVVSSIRNVRAPDDLDPGKALFLFGPKHLIRRGCAAVASNQGFERFILVLIAISSLALAVDNPMLNPESATAKFLSHVEVVLVALFSVEMVVKVCASGFLFMPKAYLKSSWNILDFVVVVISVAQLFAADSGSMGSLRSLRALRALRPLRIISRAPGLRLVLNALFASIPDVLNVAAVCFMFFIIFAILGVNYYKGILMSCQGDAYDALPKNATTFLENPASWSAMSVEKQAWFSPLSGISDAFDSVNCSAVNSDWPDSAGCCSDWPSSSGVAPTSFQVCECLGLDWDKTIPNQFDNVAVALLTLFVISTTEAWTTVMYAAVDATSVDMQPKRDEHLDRVWFFMLFLLIGAYLVMNLFVGVVIDNFKKMKTKVEVDGMLVTQEQQAWIKTQLIMHNLKPLKRVVPPAGVVGAWCFRLAHHMWFDAMVMVCILLNTIVMAMQYFGQGDIYTSFLECMNYAFYGIFLFEAVVKILAFQRSYFNDPWNRFDLFIVIGSTLGLVLMWFTGSSYGSIATIIRIFRIGRVLRLVRGFDSMTQLFNTLLVTLPSLANVGALLFLLFFIFAAMGVQLFAKVALRDAVNDQANFQSFWDSMVMLLRFTTGENWSGFMYDMAAKREECVADPEYDPDMCGFTDRPNCVPLNGCGNWAIYPYMICFTLTISFVFMNLFIGVVLDGFDSAENQQTDIITQDNFMKFARHWADFDPYATGFVSVQDLHEFLQTLFPPWGFEKGFLATERELRDRVKALKLPIFPENRVHFKDVVLALSEEVHRREAEKKGASIDLPQGFQEKLSSGWRKASRKAKPNDHLVNPISNEDVTIEHIFAVEAIQKSFRRLVAQRRREDEIGMDTAEQSNEHSSHMAVSPLVQERRNVLAPIDSTASPARSTTQGKCVSPREELEKTVAPILQKNHVEWVSPMHGGEVGSTRSTESSPQMLHGRGESVDLPRPGTRNEYPRDSGDAARAPPSNGRTLPSTRGGIGIEVSESTTEGGGGGGDGEPTMPSPIWNSP